MRLNEIFGPTVQGEGPFTGVRCAFIRYAECNLACTWCDTPYTWDWTRFDRNAESHIVEPADIGSLVNKMDVRLVVLTGGEPMMQQSTFPALRESLENVVLQVETNGTISPNEESVALIDMFVVSPKIGNSGNLMKKAMKSAALDDYATLAATGNAIFKWVAGDEDDLDEIDAWCEDIGVPEGSSWVLPLGATRDEHLTSLARIADSVIARGHNLSTRLHVLAWDTKRGV